MLDGPDPVRSGRVDGKSSVCIQILQEVAVSNEKGILGSVQRTGGVAPELPGTFSTVARAICAMEIGGLQDPRKRVTRKGEQ